MLTVGLMDATPSCLPGAIPHGEWNVLIGVPNIRANVESHYTIHVYFSRTGAVADQPLPLSEPLRTGPAWFRAPGTHERAYPSVAFGQDDKQAQTRIRSTGRFPGAAPRPCGALPEFPGRPPKEMTPAAPAAIREPHRIVAPQWSVAFASRNGPAAGCRLSVQRGSHGTMARTEGRP